MRDPKRIEECLYYIDKIWQQYPDTRFNQLIDYLQCEFNKEHDYAYCKIVWERDENYTMLKSGYVDLFNVEDDKWIEWLKGKVSNAQQN